MGACQNRDVSSFIFDVAFDCAEPRSLAEFWSAVTGYELAEARDDFARLKAPDRRGVRHLLFFRVGRAEDRQEPGARRPRES